MIARVDRAWKQLAFVAALVAGGNRLAVAQVALPAVTEPAKMQAEQVRANYTKYEYQIPMRDGLKLFTAVYVPKDDSKAYPLLLNRTPYSVGPYGVDNFREKLGPSEHFQKSGYIFVYQDVRGRWMSDG